MGLHAHILESPRSVTIALSGELHRAEFDQLEEILAHFQRRGCRQIVLDFDRLPTLPTDIRGSLARPDKIPEGGVIPTHRFSAIRP